MYLLDMSANPIQYQLDSSNLPDMVVHLKKHCRAVQANSSSLLGTDHSLRNRFHLHKFQAHIPKRLEKKDITHIYERVIISLSFLCIFTSILFEELTATAYVIYSNLVYHTCVGAVQALWTQELDWVWYVLTSWTIISCPTFIYHCCHTSSRTVVSPSTVSTLCFFIQSCLIREGTSWTRSRETTACWTVRSRRTLD